MAPGEAAAAKTAPEPLYLVQRVVSSIEREWGEDELETPEALRHWFAERGLMEMGEAVRAADLRRAVEVREGLRALLRRHNGLPLDERAVEKLDRAMSRAPVRLSFEPGRDPELVAS